ncbi:hypothetical protein KEM56_002204 [Ascosphaera pollenicola]|nr:hypothetical protein KEM56_002204 [Ascosphaera pollenicola]
MAQRVDDVMAEVITQLKSITDFFQQNGYETSAIKLSRHIRDMTVEFTEVMLKFNGDAAFKTTPAKPKHFQKKEKDRATASMPVPVPVSLLDLGVDIVPPHQQQPQPKPQPQKQISAAPKQEQPKETKKPSSSQKSLAQSWRQQPHSTGRSRIYHPLTPAITYQLPIHPAQEKNISAPRQPKVVSRPPSPPETDSDAEPSAEAPTAITKPPPFEPKKKAGVVRLCGPFETAEINQITASIHAGPIYDIVFHRAIGFAEITFLHVEHAEDFVKLDKVHREERGFSVLGQGFEVKQLDEIDWTQDHLDMYDLKVRRRLTFVGSGLLTKVTERKFMRDLLSVAQEERVDFVWPFNSGNITAVFKSVSAAKEVARHFHQLSRKSASPYYKIQVDFSYDPCEKSLPLLTRYTTNRPGKVITMNGKPTQINRPQGVFKRTRVPVKATK